MTNDDHPTPATTDAPPVEDTRVPPQAPSPIPTPAAAATHPLDSNDLITTAAGLPPVPSEEPSALTSPAAAPEPEVQTPPVMYAGPANSVNTASGGKSKPAPAQKPGKGQAHAQSKATKMAREVDKAASAASLLKKQDKVRGGWGGPGGGGGVGGDGWEWGEICNSPQVVHLQLERLCLFSAPPHMPCCWC